jgi:hypothetical protein
MTQAERAGLRLEDVPRPSLAKLRRQQTLDGQVRQVLGLFLSGRKRRGRLARGRRLAPK